MFESNMGNLNAAELITVIAAVAAAIVSVINALKQAKTSIVTQDNNAKLANIQSVANGNVSELKEELKLNRAKREYLEKVIVALADQLPKGALEKARLEVDKKEAIIGHRRKEDLNGE